MAKLGCLLIILSVVGLCAIIVIPVLPFLDDSETIDGMLEPLFCEPGEKIERDQYTTSSNRGGTTFTMAVYCVSQESGRRDVTDRWTLIGMGAFLVPFLIGLFAFIAGVGRNARQRAAVSSSPIIVGGQMLSGSMPPSSSSGASLTQRLKEIQEARNAGLITAEEYERLRQEVLDSNS
jgi:hypothetical protein